MEVRKRFCSKGQWACLRAAGAQGDVGFGFEWCSVGPGLDSVVSVGLF